MDSSYHYCDQKLRQGFGAPSGHPHVSTWEGFLEEGICELNFQTGRFEVGDGDGRGAGQRQQVELSGSRYELGNNKVFTNLTTCGKL